MIKGLRGNSAGYAIAPAPHGSRHTTRLPPRSHETAARVCLFGLFVKHLTGNAKVIALLHQLHRERIDVMMCMGVENQ